MLPFEGFQPRLASLSSILVSFVVFLVRADRRSRRSLWSLRLNLGRVMLLGNRSLDLEVVGGGVVVDVVVVVVVVAVVVEVAVLVVLVAACCEPDLVETNSSMISLTVCGSLRSCDVFCSSGSYA
jgi:hypothetical protein